MFDKAAPHGAAAMPGNTMPKLTQTLINDTQSSPDADVWLWDTEVEGLGVRILSSGRKTYIVRYRARNAQRTQRKMRIGSCSHLTPVQARAMARKVFAQVADGRDPVADIRPASRPRIATVESLFKGYVAWMRDNGKASADEVERALLTAPSGSAADALGRNRQAGEITTNDVIEFLSTFFQRGKRSSADKARSYIGSAYAWAIASANDYTVAHRQDWGVTSNPAVVIARDAGATSARSRNLSIEEIRRLWVDTLKPECFRRDVGAAIRMLIACGQRVQETLRVEGLEVGDTLGEWRMPIEKTKTKRRAHTIPLPSIIMPTILDLIVTHNTGPLFPADTIDHRLINRSIRRWLARADVDIAPFQTRDIRRTWKSRTGDGAGIDRFTRDLIQQHAKSDTGSKNYDQSDYMPIMREAMAKWSGWLGVVVSGGTPALPGEPVMRVA